MLRDCRSRNGYVVGCGQVISTLGIKTQEMKQINDGDKKEKICFRESESESEFRPRDQKIEIIKNEMRRYVPIALTHISTGAV